MKKYILLITIAILIATNIKSQAPPPPIVLATCQILKQPCNNDGIIVITIIKDLLPPYTFYYSDGKGTVHSNIKEKSDTLTGIQMCTLVYIVDSLKKTYSVETKMAAPFIIDTPEVTNAICPSKNGTAKITVNTGVMPDSVQWFSVAQEQGGTSYNYAISEYIGTGNPMNLPAGSYIAMVYYNNCNSTVRTYIQHISSITYNIETTKANCTNGTATITDLTGGISPYTYQWSNGATTEAIENLVKGNYTVTVTDAQGCYSVRYANITQAITITVNSSISDATCLEKNGSVIAFAAGGTPPYSFQYSNGTKGQTACCLPGGTGLSIIVTDTNGCTGNGYAYIKPTTPITVTYTTKPSSCKNPTGEAALTIKGGNEPYTVIWNTYPPKTGAAIDSLGAGQFGFRITDNEGCVQTGTVNIPPKNVINANISAVNAVCPDDKGTVYANVTGTNPPFTFLWNNSATAQMLTNVPPGNYICTITDKDGCSVVKSKNLGISSPLKIGLTTTPASCLYAVDGSIFAQPQGGTPPYTYKWSDGQTTNPAKGLGKGKYYVYVTDTKGCKASDFAIVDYDRKNDSCYCTVKGKVYVDANKNCLLDAGEEGVTHIMINCPGIGNTFTDMYGNYSFLVPTGSYTIKENIQNIYPLAACQENPVIVNVVAESGCLSTVNFANIVNPLRDIHILPTMINQPVPGFSYSQGLIVQNDGTIKENNIHLGFEHDGQLTLDNISPNVYTQLDAANKPNWHSVISGFASLAPGAGVLLKRTYNVPVNIPLSTVVNFKDSAAFEPPMNKWLLDYSPWNNVLKTQSAIVGSFDPNMIEVIPAGETSQGYISIRDSVLDYIIHFQNTGTYYAQNVVLIDTLDSNLDWSSVKPGYSEHNYTAEMSEDGVLKFTFKNINLPWEAMNEKMSMGLVTYSVKQKPNLTTNTKIFNRAYIYFDFNAPVETNTVQNTIFRNPNTGAAEKKVSKDINIYPNPARTSLYINSKHTEKIARINIYDVTGRLLTGNSIASESIIKIDVASLNNGIYFIEIIKSDNNKTTRKFIKN